ncbi:hypothetical protein [Campylobacter lanienae]|uniref:hypothetical protein n=1 Tax=Campylobacter lanienae TaxID=75658 RepID=UPI00242D988D|nr:hypothetical protein [Campylobacter lanienae]MDD5787139.1 hypothetical protein [Campylobacter lanienae]
MARFDAGLYQSCVDLSFCGEIRSLIVKNLAFGYEICLLNFVLWGEICVLWVRFVFWGQIWVLG